MKYKVQGTKYEKKISHRGTEAQRSISKYRNKISLCLCVSVVLVWNLGFAETSLPTVDSTFAQAGQSTMGSPITVSTSHSNEGMVQAATTNQVKEIPLSEKKVSMRFERASLDQVLTYISKITGYTIVKNTDITGDITILSEKDISVEDALDVLNSALAAKGYTAIRMEKILKIVPLDSAKEAEVKVHVGTDPSKIKPGDEFITQVMPLTYADAVEVKKDLATLMPKRGDLSSSARSNILIITDVASNVHRMAEIIKQLDAPQSSATQIRIFTLKNADAQTLVSSLNDIFKSDTLTTTGTSGGQGGGPGQFFRQFAGGAGGGPGAAATAAGTQTSAVEAAFARARASVKFSVDSRTNSIIASAPAADMMIIENLILQLDKDETEQEGTLVIHLEHGDATALSKMFTSLLQSTQTGTVTGGGGGPGGFMANLVRATQSAAQAKGSSLLGQVRIAADTDTNSLLFLTSPRNFERIKQMVTALDYARPQVMVEVLVAERTINDETQLGVEWSLMTTGKLFGNFVSSISTTLFNGTNFDLGTNITQGLRFAITNSNIQGVLQALKQNTKLNVLSTPRILTSDNNAATIKVGQHVPFLTSRQVTDTGSVYNSYSYQDVGITLTVTPHINPDGYVSMDVHPIVSQLESVTFFDAPVIDNREATTSVMVKDGETVIIGGLMQTLRNESVSKVPLLGDIPVLGLLFQSKDHSKTKTELLIFLTPHVVHNALELEKLSAPDKLRLEENKKLDQKEEKVWY